MITREWFHSGFLPAGWAYALGLALAAVVLFILWRELRGNRHAWRWLLLLTRLGLVFLLGLLLAQPNLLLTHHQEHRGRTVALVDDSASMFAADPVTDPRCVLDLARVLALPELSGRPQDLQQVADGMRGELAVLHALRKATDEALRAVRSGLPWSDASQDAVTKAAPALLSLRTTLGNLRSRQDLSVEERRLMDSALGAVGGGTAKGTLSALTAQPLQQGDWFQAERLVRECEGAVQELCDRLLARQAEADRAFLAAGGRQDSLAGTFKELTRYALARRAVAAAPALAHCELLNLSRRTAPALDAAEAAGQTDLIGPLAALLEERPLELLNAVCLLTDGAQNRTYDIKRLDAFRKRGVPLLVVGVGGIRPEEALAITDIDAPLLATLRAPLSLGLDLRLNLPPGTRIELRCSISGGTTPKTASAESRPDTGRRPGAAVARVLPSTEILVAAGAGQIYHRLQFQLAKTGFQTLKLELAVAEPALKISRELPLYVAAGRPTMLVVAEQPEVFTQALLAQRRNGIGVYPVFTYGREANAKRGESRLNLPKVAKDWSRYDLVALCGRPFPGFTREDAAALAGAVREQGVSLLVLAGTDDGYRTLLAEPFGWPVAPAAAPLAAPDAILPQEQALHLSLLRLSADVIRNRNLWQDFVTPLTWRAAPPQSLPLFVHGPTQATVASLGVCGAGRVLYVGLGGWERMNEWNAEAFNGFVSHAVMDLLCPLATWEPGQAGLGFYPPTGEPGRTSLIVGRTAAAAETSLELRVEGPGEKNVPQALAASGGWFCTARSFAQEGSYKIAAAGQERTYEVRRAISSETRDLSLREDFLRDLAVAAGGTYVPLADLPETLKRVDERTRDSIQTRTIRTLDFTYWILGLFLLLATADFALRKQIGLVM